MRYWIKLRANDRHFFSFPDMWHKPQLSNNKKVTDKHFHQLKCSPTLSMESHSHCGLGFLRWHWVFFTLNSPGRTEKNSVNCTNTAQRCFPPVHVLVWTPHNTHNKLDGSTISPKCNSLLHSHVTVSDVTCECLIPTKNSWNKL